LVVAVGLGLLAGRWLDDTIHTGIVMTLVGALLGLAAGIVSTVGQYRATLRRGAREWQSEQTTAAERAAPSQVRDT
jgi:hypothetical protein